MEQYYKFFLAILLLLTVNISVKPQIKLTPDDGQPGDRFGTDVEISDNWLIVGARQNDTNGENSGAAYIFEEIDGQWLQHTKLLPFDGEPGANFGISVDIFGEYALVGAKTSNSREGSAYIFKYSNGMWTQHQRLDPPELSRGDYFGCSVQIDNYYAAIGARADNSTGSVYIFARDGETWIQQTRLEASDQQIGNWFGNSLSLYENTLMIGAMCDNFDVGAAYIFKNNNGVWSEQQKLLGEPPENDAFGVSLSIYNNIAAIGAWGDDDNAEGAGAVYIFNYSNDTWIKTQKLLASDGKEDDHFGISVSLQDDLLAVGTVNLWTEDNSACYLFKSENDEWIEVQKLTSEEGYSSDDFGSGVLLHDSYLVISDDASDNPIPGAVYIYQNFTSSNKAVRFTEAGDYIEVPFTPVLNPNEFTVEFLLKINQLGNVSNGYAEQNIIDSRDGNSGYNFRVYDTEFPLSLEAVIGESNHIQIADIFQQDHWHHVSSTFSNNEVNIYIDGQLRHTSTLQSSFIQNNISNLRIGDFLGYPLEYLGLRGCIDELRIWDHARTASDISNLMNENITGNEEGLLGYWNFNFNVNGKIKDLTANHNDGMIFGQCSFFEAEPIITDIDNYVHELPSQFVLYQNYPNPFNPVTTVLYSIPERGNNLQSERVSIMIYDVLGRLIERINIGHQPPGHYKFHWNASQHPSGCYILKVTAGCYSESIKMLLLK